MKIPGRKLAKRALIAVLLAAQLNSTAFYAWADAVSAGAQAGQEVGAVGISSFIPQNYADAYSEIFPDSNRQQTIELEGVFGKDEETVQVGQQAGERLKEEKSTDGEAYRTVMDSNKASTPDLRNDPMFNVADTVRSKDFMSSFKGNFSDCKSTDKFETVKMPAHISKLRTCERVVDGSGSFEFTHDYGLGVIEYVSGQPNFQSCGEGCLHIWVGTVGDNYLSGSCNIYEEYTRFRVLAKGAILSATIDQAVFDDYFQVMFNDELVWTHTPGVFPPETGGDCERNTNWNVNPNTNVTEAFSEKYDVITFKTRTSVTGRGEGYARIKILYDPSKAFVDNGWSPKERLKVFNMINDGFCEGSTFICTEMPAVDDEGCVTQNGARICPSDAAPSPHPDINPFCKKVTVNASCDFYKGAMECFKDHKGVERCHTNNGGRLDSCEEYEKNPACGFVSQGCIRGASGSSGACYAHEEVWDCGYDASYETAMHTGTQVDCPGEARCMGSECFDTSNKKSGDFAYAVAMLQVAQFAEHDLACGDPGGVTADQSCKVFKGEAMECKKALGGYVDCCEAPEGVSVFDYVNLTMSSLKMASSIEAVSRHGSMASASFGYWQATSEAISAGFSTLIKREWSSVIGNATGAFNKQLGGEVSTTMLSKFQGWLMEKTYEAMVDMGATSAANAIFQPAASGQGMALTSQAMAVVNFIGMVYTVYVIADLLIKVIWECEEKEFELGAKKETRQCYLVGSYCASKALGSCVEKRESYCCFGSVVARIIQEQGRPQLGMNFGDPQSPQCEGLTPDQLSRMDWSRIDLSEWIGMLNMTGHLPTVDSINLEASTGSGSSLGDVFDDGARMNTLERNRERLDGFDADEIKKQAETELRVFQ